MEKWNSILFVKVKLFVIKVPSAWTRTPCGPSRWQKRTSKLVLTISRHLVSGLGCSFLFPSSQEQKSTQYSEYLRRASQMQAISQANLLLSSFLLVAVWTRTRNS